MQLVQTLGRPGSGAYGTVFEVHLLNGVHSNSRAALKVLLPFDVDRWAGLNQRQRMGRVRQAAAIADKEAEIARAAAAAAHPAAEHVVQVLLRGKLSVPGVADELGLPSLLLELCRGGTLEVLRTGQGHKQEMLAAGLMGRPLEGLRIRHGALPELLVRRLLRQVALGMTALHHSNTIWRDGKPANVLLKEPLQGAPDEVPVAKVADFGVSRLLSGVWDFGRTQNAGTKG